MLRHIFGGSDGEATPASGETRVAPTQKTGSKILDDRVPIELTPAAFDRLFGK